MSWFVCILHNVNLRHIYRVVVMQRAMANNRKKGGGTNEVDVLFFKLLAFLLFSLPTDLKVPTYLKIIPYDPKMM